MADEVTEKPDGILAEFLSWCEQNGLILSKKVKVGLQGSCHRYGMIAVEDIKKRECLFEIPRSLVLQPNTSSIPRIVGNLANEEHFGSERGSGWAPLLLTLMYEYTNPASHWKPYMNLVPDVTVLDQPMFWDVEERQKELQGTGLEEDIESDVQRIEEEYNTIALPFIKKHPQYFSESRHNVALYKHMAAFVMAYSFTEQKSSNEDDDEDDDDDDDDDDDPAPAMVPMADILNHISNNNAHLEFGAETLTMVATQDIHKGEEVFNTYGKLANCHLLQSYGFVEDELPNPYDMVDIPISAFIEVTKASQSQQTTRVLDAKFEFMEEMGVASEDDMFLFGREGCSHFGPDLYATLRILHLSERQFQQLLQQQIQQQRSEEFDDIGYVLDQSDEEMKKDTRWRILELIFKAENKKKKRGLDENDMEMKQKKKKKIHVEESDSMEEPEDGNLGVTVERNSQSKSTCLNGSLQTDNVTSEPNESKNDCSNLPQTGLDTNVDRSEDLSKNSKHNLVEGEGGARDMESAGNDDDDDDDDGGKGHNSDDGGDDDDDDDDVDDDHNSNINDDDDVHDDHNSNYDDDDDDDVVDDDDDDNDDDPDDSEQPLTYEIMSQWPIEWRRTLKSVAELCVKQRYGDCNMCKDRAEEEKLSKRQMSVLRIKRGQRSIFQRICELVIEDNTRG